MGTFAADTTSVWLRSEEPLLAIDEKRRVVVWNEAAERLTGVRADEARGRACWEVLGVVDSSGRLICGPDCPLPRSAPDSAPVPRLRVSIRTRLGRQDVSLASFALGCDGRRLLFHLLLDPALSEAARIPSGSRPALTPRQAEVLALLAEGLTTDEIRLRLVLSKATVRNHIRALLRALGCRSRLEAVVKARRLGLI